MDEFKANILVVDDDLDSLDIIKKILTKQNYQVSFANNGSDALLSIKRELPDLVLLDITIPEIDGFEVCQQLKSEQTTSDIPIVFISGRNDIEDKMEAFAVGGVDYITKPFQLQEILVRVETHLTIHSLKNQLQQANESLEEKIRTRTKELKDSEEMFSTLIKNIPGVCYRCNSDEHWTMELISDEIEELSGYPASDFIQNRVRSYASIIHKDDIQMVEDTVMAGLERKETFIIEYRIIHADGSLRWVYEKGVGLFSKNGELSYLDGVILDITQRKHNEAELRSHRDRLDQLVKEKTGQLKDALDLNEKIFNSTSHGVLAYEEKSGRCIFANPAIGKIVGATVDQLLKQNFREIPPWQTSGMLEIAHEVLKTSKSKESDFHFKTTFGKEVWLKVNFTSFINKQQLHLLIIVEDISLRKNVEADLIKSREEADRANRSKSEFLANMSHEIRTPMNAIIGMSEMAISASSPVKIQEYLAHISHASNSLLRIINDILDFSKIEAGKLELENEVFTIHNVFDNMSDMFRVEIQKRDIELIMRFSANCIHTVVGDALRLEQILRNLIGNAIKFTKEGEVEVRAQTVETTKDRVMLKFSVRDTGIGMEPDQTDELFSPFIQADSSTTRRYGGTGLGLAICKHIVKKMDGEIWVESSLGKGSNFYFTAGFNKLPNNEKRDILRPPDDLQQLKVLVVDDNLNMCRSLEEILNIFTFQTVPTNSTQAAIKAVKEAIDLEQPFKLMLIEQFGSNIDGSKITDFIHKIYKDKNILFMPKIVLLSDSDNENKETHQQFDEDRFDAFVAKPINCSLLFDTVMDVFGKNIPKTYIPQKQKIDQTTIWELLGGARVLLVEDLPINVQVAGEILDKAGIIVDVAMNGQEAIERAINTDYDVVLMDIHMPEMDGYKATEIIRDYKSKDILPIIAMTADAMTEDKEKCLATGMNDHIAKPIEKNALFTSLIKWITPKQSFTHTKTRKNISVYDELEFPKMLSGIDIDSALQRLENNKKLLFSLLVEFNSDFSQTGKQLRTAIENTNKSDLDIARTLTHSVKGLAGNISANELYIAASNLEKGILDNNLDQLPNLLEIFEENFNEVLNSINTVIEKQKQSSENQLKETDSKTISTSNMQNIAALLQELEINLNRRSSRAQLFIESLFPLLKDSSNPEVFGLLLKLEKQIKKENYKKAQVSLKQLSKIIDINFEAYPL
ncbi:MAG: response regulator [Magnetococcales bacterium]|nr:response regulator [Magnetococcales bacterium]